MMGRQRGHTEEPILAALQHAEGGTTLVEVCRQVGITEQTCHTWKRKYAGLGLSKLQKLPSTAFNQTGPISRKLNDVLPENWTASHLGPTSLRVAEIASGIVV